MIEIEILTPSFIHDTFIWVQDQDLMLTIRKQAVKVHTEFGILWRHKMSINAVLPRMILVVLGVLWQNQIVYAGADVASSFLLIDQEQADQISQKLTENSNDTIYTIRSDGDITVKGSVVWSTSTCLSLEAAGNIIVMPTGKFANQTRGCLYLKAGIGDVGEEQHSRGHIVIEDRTESVITMQEGTVRAYYVPEKGEELHKYHNPGIPKLERFTLCSNPNCLVAYMLVDTPADLQDINVFLAGNYALSRDIDLSAVNNFKPLKSIAAGQRGRPFSGKFDGNGFSVIGLHIDTPSQDKVGLFGMCGGFKDSPATIDHLTLLNPQVTGDTYVGPVVGWGTYCNLSDIKVVNPVVLADDIAGGAIGTALHSHFSGITVRNATVKTKLSYRGLLIGTFKDCGFEEIPNVELMETDSSKLPLPLWGRIDSSYFGFSDSADLKRQ